MSKKFMILGFLLLLLVPTAVFASAGIKGGAQHFRELAQVRRATAKYKDVNVAIADGYLPTDHCVDQPGSGMGYHYIHPELASDLVTDPLRPELMIYAPHRNGLKLVAVEWFQPDLGQPHPSIFGVPFDGPMDGHEPGMPVHYDLHAWIWFNNPDGVFTAWNPNISCNH